ncbi:MAG: DUF2442 domain-containing protein [Planctomycetota bacterium]
MGAEPRAVAVRVTSKVLEVELADGRRLTTPIAWFPRLARASTRARNRWELLGDGLGIHWTELEEDLSVAGLLQGTRVPSPQRKYPKTTAGTGSMLARDAAKKDYRARAPRSKRRAAKGQ